MKDIFGIPFNIWTRPKADGTIDVISLAHDKPFLQNEITFQPGKSYLFRVSLDINELFQSSLNSAELISHWPVPLAIAVRNSQMLMLMAKMNWSYLDQERTDAVLQMVHRPICLTKIILLTSKLPNYRIRSATIFP